jgi:hypothetical protein
MVGAVGSRRETARRYLLDAMGVTKSPVTRLLPMSEITVNLARSKNRDGLFAEGSRT